MSPVAKALESASYAEERNPNDSDPSGQGGPVWEARRARSTHSCTTYIYRWYIQVAEGAARAAFHGTKS